MFGMIPGWNVVLPTSTERSTVRVAFTAQVLISNRARLLVQRPRVGKIQSYHLPCSCSHLLNNGSHTNQRQIHGFPDLAVAWRYQIPMLRAKGLRVVAPDCLGYGQTVCRLSSPISVPTGVDGRAYSMLMRCRMPPMLWIYIRTRTVQTISRHWLRMWGPRGLSLGGMIGRYIPLPPANAAMHSCVVALRTAAWSHWTGQRKEY